MKTLLVMLVSISFFNVAQASDSEDWINIDNSNYGKYSTISAIKHSAKHRSGDILTNCNFTIYSKSEGNEYGKTQFSEKYWPDAERVQVLENRAGNEPFFKILRKVDGDVVKGKRSKHEIKITIDTDAEHYGITRILYEASLYIPYTEAINKGDLKNREVVYEPRRDVIEKEVISCTPSQRKE